MTGTMAMWHHNTTDTGRKQIHVRFIYRCKRAKWKRSRQKRNRINSEGHCAAAHGQIHQLRQWLFGQIILKSPLRGGGHTFSAPWPTTILQILQHVAQTQEDKNSRRDSKSWRRIERELNFRHWKSSKEDEDTSNDQEFNWLQSVAALQPKMGEERHFIR